MNSQRRRRTAAVVAVATLALAACGGGANGSASTAAAGQDQPANDGSGALDPGVFTDLPKPAGAVPLSPPTQQDGAWSQSYRVVGLTPQGAMAFYQSNLISGWALTAPTVAIGGGCDLAAGPANGCEFRGVWMNGNMTLEVTTDPDATVAAGDPAATELDLLLTGLN
jgi:hypothetical protein